MIKIIRATTVPQSLDDFCRGVLSELSKKYEVIGLSSPGPELEEVATREGVRVMAVPMERRISVIKDCKSLWRVWRTFRKENPTMVHSMTPKAGMLCMVGAWLAHVPVRVHTFTGLVFPTTSGLKRRVLMFTDWLTCACATHVIPEGEGVKNDLISYGITKKPMRILGYGNVKGVDLEHFRRTNVVLNAAERIKNNLLFTFLFVGRVVRDKGINELIAAFIKLYQSYPRIRLILVGQYENDLDPINVVAQDSIERHKGIIAVGKKTGMDLLAYYAASDCFVFPSYREGFPNTVLEAGAMGLPSIVTDINGSREIIVGGENGMIIPPKNTDALYQAMLNMMENKELREKMAGNARGMIASRFEQGFVRKCLYEFYEAVLPTEKD